MRVDVAVLFEPAVDDDLGLSCGGEPLGIKGCATQRDLSIRFVRLSLEILLAIVPTYQNNIKLQFQIFRATLHLRVIAQRQSACL